MAQIKLSQGFSEIKGVMGGTIFQGYRGTTVMRSRTSGGGRTSGVWDRQKAKLAQVASSWRFLTGGQRGQWQAAAPNYPYIDKFGDPQIPSGFQLYCTLNLNLLQVGEPTVLIPAVPGAKPDISIVALSVASLVDFTATWTATPSSDHVVLIFASNTQSRGVREPPTRWRFLGSFDGTLATSGNLFPLYGPLFGSLLKDGVLAIKATVTDITTGENFSEFVAAAAT